MISLRAWLCTAALGGLARRVDRVKSRAAASGVKMIPTGPGTE